MGNLVYINSDLGEVVEPSLASSHLKKLHKKTTSIKSKKQNIYKNFNEKL